MLTQSGRIIARTLLRNSLLDYGTYQMPIPVAEETIWNAWAIYPGEPLTNEQIAAFKAAYPFGPLPPSSVNDDDMKSILAALDKITGAQRANLLIGEWVSPPTPSLPSASTDTQSD